MAVGSPDNPATPAFVAYITFIGWLIAYFGFYRNNKTQLTAFHIRQSLLLHILSLALDVFYSFSPARLSFFIISSIVALLLFALWLIGFMDALNKREKAIPFIGSLAQAMFRAM